MEELERCNGYLNMNVITKERESVDVGPEVEPELSPSLGSSPSLPNV